MISVLGACMSILGFAVWLNMMHKPFDRHMNVDKESLVVLGAGCCMSGGVLLFCIGLY